MAGENTVSSMEMYKEQYGKLNEVVPGFAVLYDLIPFPEEDRTGDSFRQSAIMTNEHGFHYNGSGGGVATLNAPVQAVIKESNASGYEVIGRARLTYAAASRGLNSKRAFKETWGTVLMNLRKASMKRHELSSLYGQLGLGIVSGALSTETATITDASWSAATWAGLETCPIEVFTTSAATATQHGETDGIVIASMSLTGKTVTSATSDFSGDTPVDDADVIYFKGAKTTTGYNEFAGLMKIAQNTGDLFGIDAASYAMWAGNLKTSVGTPTMGKFLNAATDLVDRGVDEKIYLLVCPRTWEVLNSDLAAQRMFDGSYSKARATNGSQAITYYGQVGEIELRVHPYLRQGEAVMFPLSGLRYIGSADVGMGVPGTPGMGAEVGEDGRAVFFHDTTTNTVEARTFYDKALFCDAPSHLVHISGLTYP